MSPDKYPEDNMEIFTLFSTYSSLFHDREISLNGTGPFTIKNIRPIRATHINTTGIVIDVEFFSQNRLRRAIIALNCYGYSHAIVNDSSIDIVPPEFQARNHIIEMSSCLIKILES